MKEKNNVNPALRPVLTAIGSYSYRLNAHPVLFHFWSRPRYDFAKRIGKGNVGVSSSNGVIKTRIGRLLAKSFYSRLRWGRTKLQAISDANANIPFQSTSNPPPKVDRLNAHWNWFGLFVYRATRLMSIQNLRLCHRVSQESRHWKQSRGSLNGEEEKQ